MSVITKEQIVEAIEKIQNVNVWAVSENVELTLDDETGQVIVWNACGDYDAWYGASEVDMILNEAQNLDDFYINNPCECASHL
jgi:hypothetical protein